MMHVSLMTRWNSGSGRSGFKSGSAAAWTAGKPDAIARGQQLHRVRELPVVVHLL